MKIAILEDDIFFQNKIVSLLNITEDLIHVYTDVDSYDSSSTFYDLLLLDITLGDKNGIDYINSHENKQIFIVYISNHEECMIYTFNSNVLGFIPKRDIDKLLGSKIQFVREKLQNMHKVSMPILGENILIRENEILMIYLLEGIIYTLLENKKTYRLTYETLKSVENELSNQFFRISNSCIINISKIVQINNIDHVITLVNGDKLQVSRRRWKDVKLRYVLLKTNI